QSFRRRRLLLQRLGKVPPRLGELAGARFELLFQFDQRIGPVANVRSHLRSGRTKLAAARSAICPFASQDHLVGTVTGPPSVRPKSSLSILTELHDELAPFNSITSSAAIRGTDLWNISPGSRGSLRLDVGRANDLGPLVSFMGDQLAEFGGRKHKRRASQFGESRLYFEIGEANVDLLVENADDLGRRVLRCPNTNESARFIAG